MNQLDNDYDLVKEDDRFLTFKNRETGEKFKVAKPDRILICIPNMGTIKAKTVASLLAMDKTDETNYCMISSSLIYDARDMMVGEAIKGNYDYLLFVDSDIEFEKDALLRLLNRRLDIVTAIYYKRGGEHDPVIYRKIAPLTKEREVTCVTETEVDRDLFPIAGCGMGFCLIKVDVLKDMIKRYPSLFCPIDGLGEDLSFCYRASECGYEIYADGSIPLNHWGEIAFGRASFDKDGFEKEHS